MSFPKAKMKRFNDVDDNVPPVGAYDPVVKKEETGAVFDKAERFKKPSDVLSASMTRVRSKDSLTDVKITPNVTPSQRDNGREIRVLAREKSDLSRKVENQTSELKRLEEQLNSVIADRDELENINDNLKARLNLLESSSEEGKSRCERISEYTAELEDLKSIVTEKDVVIEKLRKDVTSVRSELENGIINETTLREHFKSFADMFSAQIQMYQSSTQSSLLRMNLRFQDLKETFELWRKNVSNQLKEEMEKSCQLESRLAIEVAGGEELSRNLESVRLEFEEAVSRENSLKKEISVMASQLELAKEQELAVLTLKEEMKESLDSLRDAELYFETEMAEEESKREKVEFELQNLKIFFKELERSLEEEKMLESSLRSALVAETEKSSLLDSTRQQLEESICENGHLKETIEMMSTQLELNTQEHEMNIKTILADIEKRRDSFKEREHILDARLNEEILKREIVETELETLKKLDLASKDYEMTIRNLQDAIKEQSDALKENEIELKAKITEEISARQLVESEFEQHKREMQIMQTNFEEEKAMHLETEKVLKSSIDMAEESTRNRDIEIENLKSKLSELSVERDMSEEMIKKLRKDITRKDGELSQFQEVIAKNHELVSVKGSLVQDLEACHRKLSAVISANDELMKSMNNYSSDKLHLESRVNALINDNLKLAADVKRLTKRESELLQEFQISDDKIRTMQQDFSRSTRELHKRLVETEKELNGYKTRTDLEGKHNETLLQRVTSEYETRIQMASSEADVHQKEMIKWRTLYEQLKEKIAPFQEQLDAYEIEKQLLASQNVEATSTMKKMGDQLATLVGHHNQRQRIHYVKKLKEDFFNVKQENDKLWAEVLKLRKVVAGSSAKSTKKFDPKQAFQHSKENHSSPLRDSNH